MGYGRAGAEARPAAALGDNIPRLYRGGFVRRWQCLLLRGKYYECQLFGPVGRICEQDVIVRGRSKGIQVVLHTVTFHYGFPTPLARGTKSIPQQQVGGERDTAQNNMLANATIFAVMQEPS